MSRPHKCIHLKVEGREKTYKKRKYEKVFSVYAHTNNVVQSKTRLFERIGLLQSWLRLSWVGVTNYFFSTQFNLRTTLRQGVGMTTFYYFSANDQSGLLRNFFSKYTCITLIHHNVPQNFRFNFRCTYKGFIGQKVLKLWRQESWPFGPGWAAELLRIGSWTSRGPPFSLGILNYMLCILNEYCNK